MRIGHQRTSTRAAPWAYRDAVIFCPLDNNVELKLQPIAVALVDRLVLVAVAGIALSREKKIESIRQAIVRDLAEELILGHALRNFELRQENLAQTHVHAAALGDHNAVFQRFGNIRKQRRHLVRAF